MKIEIDDLEALMIQKIINFLNNHRLILVILILTLISLTFLTIKSIVFLHHKFNSFNCTQELDETHCFHNDIQILIEPEKTKEKVFKEKSKEIKELQQNYKLPKFSKYTSYYYEVASLMYFKETGEYEELVTFFKNYNRSYDIVNFYKKNVIYFDLFYHYKIV